MVVVLDTSSFISAMRSPLGAARFVLELILDRRLLLLMDQKLGLEYRDVALRREHLRASGIEKHAMLHMIEELESLATAVDIVQKHRPLSPDPDDDLVLDVAINGHADVLITNNRRHFARAAKPFGIQILSPAELLEKLRKERKYVN